MRITFNMQSMQYNQFVENGLTSMTEATLRVINKRNLLSPEQSPTKYVGAYNIQRMIDELTQFKANATNASSWLTNTDKEMTNLIELLKKAKSDLAIAGTSSESDADSRKALAGDAAGLFKTLMDVANSSYLGRYIFGGFQTENKPFSDGTNEVTGVNSVTGNGGDVGAKSVFSDLSEFKSGKYTAKVTVADGIGTLKIFDEKGNPVILDSNGADQSGSKGNNTATEITFEYKPGAVVNTGRGISIKMPAGAAIGTEMSFNYKAGSEVNYEGDMGSILAQIGYNQDIAMNMPGSSIFTQTFKTLQGTRFNTIGGMAATLGTLFSALDKSGSSLGDSINVSGTDYNGRKVGSATILSPINPKLDLSTASDKERTLTVGYGDKLYKIVVPQGAYKSTDELSEAINNQLKKAEYVGSLSNIPGGTTQDAYKTFIQNQLGTGNFDGAVTDADKQKYYTDISGEVSVSADGDRINFATTKAGDNVRLSVSGGTQNMLGFKNLTTASFGKDTVFDIGNDFHTDRINQIKTSHPGINLSAGGTQQFVINGQFISFAIPTATPTTSRIGTSIDLSGTTDYSFNVKGREVTIKAADLAGATTMADKQTLINKAIEDAGMAGEANVVLTNDGTGLFHTDLTTLDVSQKDYEIAFDKALRSAGFDFGINVSLTPTSGTPGVYSVNFNMVNNNLNKDTSLTVTHTDATTVPPTTNLQYAAPAKNVVGSAKEKTLGDLVKFVKNLYGDSVNVSLTNGKLVVQDTRSGNSKLSLNIKGMNEGVYASTDKVSVGGKFTGSYDDKWNVNMTGTLNADGTRDISVAVTDRIGNRIYDKTIKNYVGGNIELPYGVSIDPSDMNLSATNPTFGSTFDIDLKSKGSLGFGDMNVVDNGSNVNIFRTLKNLQHALLYDITKNGFSEPTAWKDAGLKSSAKPFLDGAFQGTFNDKWNYEIAQQNGKNDMYLQNEYKDSTGDIRYDAAMVANLGSNLSFGVDYFDNSTGESKTMNVSVDLTKANPPITDAKSMQNYILKTLNDDDRFVGAGLRFTSKDGKIQMESGSGTKIVNFSNNATGSTKALTSYIMGFDTPANAKTDYPLTVAAGAQFQITDPFATNAGGDLATKQINIPAGTYATKEDLLLAVNGQLNSAAPVGTAGRVKAEFDDKGALVFKTTGDVVVSSSAFGGTNPLNLALTDGVDTQNFATAAQPPATNLKEASDAQRTLTFKYTAGTPPVKQTLSIILDKKEYGSAAEIADAVNEKLVAAGIASADMKASVNSKGELTFLKSTNNITGVSVEGDYDGFLGFPKAGDEAKVKVTDTEGRIVQEVTLNMAGKSVHVSDGLMLGFNKGSLKATDSFSAAVGSGVENEIPILDKALSQVLNASTIVGNRGGRVETVLSFQETVIKSNESIKAGYLGSSDLDQAKAQTDWNLATKAYESALSVVGKVMSISLLDFLG